jgi:hypothetical protein
VDVTADQFGEAVVVSAQSRWHIERPIRERIQIDERHVDLLRSFPRAKYTRLVFESF